MNSYKKVICAMAFAFILLGISPAAFADTIFVATLQGSQESTPNNSPATGVGSVILNAAETQVTIKLQFSGLTSNQVAGHIHAAAPRGANSGVFIGFTSGGTTSGTVNMTSSVTPQRVSELKNGLWYFNVHSQMFSGGEIRGQIEPLCNVATNCPNSVATPNGTSISVNLNSVTRADFSNVDTNGNTVATLLNKNALPPFPGTFSTYSIIANYAYDIRTSAGLNANSLNTFTFTLPATITETNFNNAAVLHFVNGAWVDVTSPTRDFATRTLSTNNITSFSPFVVVAPSVVTAASANIGGRITSAKNRGIRNAYVTIMDADGTNMRTTVTNFNGSYSFDNVVSGRTYVISVRAKRHTFESSAQAFAVTGDANDINFTALQ